MSQRSKIQFRYTTPWQFRQLLIYDLTSSDGVDGNIKQKGDLEPDLYL